MSFFTDQTKQLYLEMFTALQNSMAQIAQEMQNIQLIYVQENIAKYRIRKSQMINGQNEIITYYIYFIIDEDGLWKLNRF